MTGWALRLLVLGAVVSSAFLVAWLWSRRNPRVESGGLTPGLTVITGPDCRLCDPAVAALHRAGAVVTIVDDEGLRARLKVRSLPTAVVVAAGGEIVARRSGRAVIDDALALAEAAAVSAVKK